MKKRIILFFLFVLSIFCIKAQVKIGMEQNIDIFLPLTETAQKYEYNKNDLRTNTFSIFSNYELSISQKFIFVQP